VERGQLCEQRLLVDRRKGIGIGGGGTALKPAGRLRLGLLLPGLLALALAW